jgi:uncharacterized protein (DUF302 family)
VEAAVSASRYPFDETVERLQRAIAAGGATLFAALDQRAAAKAAGLDLRPTTLLVFGNPKGGTPLMDAFPLTALDLPFKLLIWEENGVVRIGRVPVAAIAERYAVTGLDDLLARLQTSLDALVATVT